MSIQLAQWLPEDSTFTSRDNALNVVKFLLGKQPILNAENRECSPQLGCAAHYNDEAASVEHIARLMWGAVPANNELKRDNEALRLALLSGISGENENAWSNLVNYDQKIVEMSSFAVAIVDAPDTFWNPLSDAEKQALIDWMTPVQELDIPPNNWRWFRVLIVFALERVGVDIQRDKLQQDLDFIDSHYMGQGWYQDGEAAVMDYYNPFAFHFYGLVYARWIRDTRSDESEKYVNRAVEFAQSYQYWFGENGAQLCYGRSLNYRFAGAGFWSELAWFEPKGIAMSSLKSHWVSSVRWWARQPIWSQDGQLLSGFAYPNLLASEFYTSPVSPLLALKAFSALRLSEDHAFWQAENQPLEKSLKPTWVCDQHFLWRDGGCYLLTNAPPSGELRHCYDKYSKFAYSSEHGLCVESEQWISQGFAGDNMLAFQHPETQSWHARTKNEEAWREGEKLVSVWSPFKGIRVVTTQWLNETGNETREHNIQCESDFNYVMTGHAVDVWTPWFSHLERKPARVESERLFSEIILEYGEGDSAVYPCAPNTNLLYAHASVPAVSGKVRKGSSTLKALILAGRTTSIPEN